MDYLELLQNILILITIQLTSVLNIHYTKNTSQQIIHI